MRGMFWFVLAGALLAVGMTFSGQAATVHAASCVHVYEITTTPQERTRARTAV